ncbi:hypothetical protein [Streptomyces antibioticus]|uniref:Uncharacterized protein n=1 Tax=Streptomyces antibioticus TaxID=1890 RepID=A0ABX3LEM5_STRAT|nr:hypothetical protein [Streptomyces antibioticus]MCX5170773.1 hypothetical protein [Streptomyces antibioticus]OOQ49023.1 hypothetical protein AFM16_22320 [Streptomyces antibioticus]
MNCTSGNPVVDLVKGFFSFLGDPIGTIVELIAKTILAGAVAVFAALTTNVPTLEETQTSKNISGDTQWIVVYLAVGSLIFAAARMALERRSDAGRTALMGILRVILVSGAATTVVVAGAAVADDFSNYLFNNAVRESLSNVGACSDGSGIQSFLLLVLAFLLLIAGIIHTVLMYIRLGVMMVLLGTLPMAAAASMTDWGAGWWRKHIGWLIAWLLYKPAVALVLNAGMAMINAGRNSGSGDAGSINTRIAGIGVMLLSAIALPALLKLIVPATAAMGTGNPMAAMGQAGSSLATGAVMVGGGRGGGSGAGAPAGPSGPSGASGSGGGSGAAGSSGAGGEPGATGSGGADGVAAASRAGGASGAGAAGSGAAAAGGPAGVAVLTAVAAAQVASSTVSGAVEGSDGELGNNK